jgi:hypothetical protein
VKAILMATAVHNIEGATRLSELDGAGGMSLDEAESLAADPSRWRIAGVSPTSFNASGNIDLFFNAAAGQTVRAVIAWDATPSYALYDDQPGSDLDLSVFDPNGWFVASSASWDNTYEIVEFVAPATGTYRLQVHRFRFDDSFTFLGAAWYNR